MTNFHKNLSTCNDMSGNVCGIVIVPVENPFQNIEVYNYVQPKFNFQRPFEKLDLKKGKKRNKIKY